MPTSISIPYSGLHLSFQESERGQRHGGFARDGVHPRRLLHRRLKRLLRPSGRNAAIGDFGANTWMFKKVLPRLRELAHEARGSRKAVPKTKIRINLPGRSALLREYIFISGRSYR